MKQATIEEMKREGAAEAGRLSVHNTSGQGKTAVIPPEIKGWNWRALLLTWIWGIGNRVWISLVCLIPIVLVQLVFAILLGAKGNEWAWRSKRWDSIEHFRRTQRTWRNWAIGVLVVVGIISFIISFIVGWLIGSEVLY